MPPADQNEWRRHDRMSEQPAWIQLAPTDEDFAWWRKHFVPEHVLWLWDDSPIPHADQVEIIPRADLRTHRLTSRIEMANAFITWAITSKTISIVIDDGHWRDLLSPEELDHARSLQIQLKRGLCFPSPLDGTTLVLDQRVWSELTDVQRNTIVRNQLADWDEPVTLPCPENAPAHIRSIANRFLMVEGANCFATVAYAVTGDDTFILRWIWQDELRRILTDAGYVESTDTTPESGDVMAISIDNVLVHAAFVIAPDRLLNKNGQSSFNPVWIIDFATLQREWPDGETIILRRA